MRRTRQREAIHRAFDEASRPLGPEEIQEIAKQSVSDLNLATVYRNLKVMVEAGDLVTVEVPGRPDRYESAGLSHHHHFLCNACDRLYDLPGCPKGLAKLAPEGFRVDGHDLTLSGLCRDCA